MLRVYSYCKHFYLQGQVYQHSRQLKSVIIYLRVFECRSVALAENQPSEGCKTTAKASVRHRLVIVGHTWFIISALSCMKGRWAGLQSGFNSAIIILNVLLFTHLTMGLVLTYKQAINKTFVFQWKNWDTA